MRQLHWLATIFAWPVFFEAVDAFTLPCLYQSEKCGYTLMSVYGTMSSPIAQLEHANLRTSGYTQTELIHAVNQTPSIPPLSAAQLPQVIYHCQDILGNIVGNAFCMNGCLRSQNLTTNDECQIAGNGTCTGTVTVTSTTTTTTTTTAPFPGVCVKYCRTWCIGGDKGDYTGLGGVQETPTVFPTIFQSNVTTTGS